MTLLDRLQEQGLGVFGVGKIEDIFAGHGISHAKHTGSNKEGLVITTEAILNQFDLKSSKVGTEGPDRVGLIFTNLVDTDSLFGHRRDVRGYAGALKEIDEWLGRILESMQSEDLLIISSDHGNDPTAPGTDHTREYVPLLAYSPSIDGSAHDVGTRKGFCDIARTIADWLDVDWTGPGTSFVPQRERIA
jgi:phosphopentomutase